ncbi:Copia protein, partial [Mucuna pruriens]
MEEELKAIEKNHTWELVTLPHNKRSVGVKLVYRLKVKPTSEVAKGFLQKTGLDYNEVFAPVARIETIKLVVAAAIFRGWLLHQLDVKSAFLNGPLKEDRWWLCPHVRLNTLQPQYIAASMGACQALWLENLMTEMKIRREEPMKMLIDNKSAISLAKHPIAHGISKHIETRFHFLRDQVSKGKLELKYCSTNEQVEDILTKLLKGDQFKMARDMIGLHLPHELTKSNAAQTKC